MVDAERKADFEEAGSHFESSYFLTFTYLPPAEDAARAETWLYEGREKTGIDAQEVMSGFTDRTDRLLHLIEAFMPECRWLDDSETLTYLHSCVSTHRHRVRVPETPMHLDALLADQPLTGGLEPRLGVSHLRVQTITGFPTATTPGLLDELNRLAFPYRWSTRAILLDKTDATKLLTKIRRQWFAKRKSIAAILKEVMTNEQSALVDTDASNKAADADLALQELGADYAGIAYVTATVTVWDAEARSLTTYGFYGVQKGYKDTEESFYFIHRDGWERIFKGMDATQAAKIIKQRGYLTTDGGRYQKALKIKGRTQKLYWVSAAILEHDFADDLE